MKLILRIGFWVLIVSLIPACSPVTETATLPPQATKIEPISTATQAKTQVESQESQETQEPEMELACTISLWHSFNENEIQSLINVSELYREIQPNVEFDFLFSPNFDIRNKFENAAGSGGGPSILIGSGEWGPEFLEKSIILDFSELIDNQQISKINPAALEIVGYQESLLGLPLNLKGVLMFRNKNIILNEPETISELINLSQSATTGDLIGAYLDYGLYYSAGHLEAMGGSLMDSEGNPSFNDQNGIEWLEMLKRYEDAGPVEQNSDNDVNLFKEGRVGLIISDLSIASDLGDAIGIENLKVDRWPEEMSGFVESDVIYLNANLTGRNLECGWSFAEYLISENSQEVFSDPFLAGFIPSILGIELTDSIQREASNAFEDGIPFPIAPQMDAYWEPLNFAIQSVVEFGNDPNEALLAAETEILGRLSEMQQEN